MKLMYLAVVVCMLVPVLTAGVSGTTETCCGKKPAVVVDCYAEAVWYQILGEGGAKNHTFGKGEPVGVLVTVVAAPETKLALESHGCEGYLYVWSPDLAVDEVSNWEQRRDLRALIRDVADWGPQTSESWKSENAKGIGQAISRFEDFIQGRGGGVRVVLTPDESKLIDDCETTDDGKLFLPLSEGSQVHPPGPVKGFETQTGVVYARNAQGFLAKVPDDPGKLVMRVFQLSYADPLTVATILQQLTPGNFKRIQVYSDKLLTEIKGEGGKPAPKPCATMYRLQLRKEVLPPKGPPGPKRQGEVYAKGKPPAAAAAKEVPAVLPSKQFSVVQPPSPGMPEVPPLVAKPASDGEKPLGASTLSTAPRSAIVATGTESDLKDLEADIRKLDRRPRVVELEVCVCDVSREGLENLGVQWSNDAAGLGNTLGANWKEKADAAGYVSSSVQDFHLVRSPGNLAALLNLLVKEGKAEILAKPRLSTLEGEEATFFAGESVPYVSKLEVTDGQPVQQYTYLDVGVRLNFVPRLTFSQLDSPGTPEELTILVRPVISTLKESTSSGESPPVLLKREAQTTVRVQPGDSFVISGLITKQEQEIMSKVPLLGDLPLLGKLFRNRHKTSESREIVVTVTPRVLPLDGSE